MKKSYKTPSKTQKCEQQPTDLPHPLEVLSGKAVLDCACSVVPLEPSAAGFGNYGHCYICPVLHLTPVSPTCHRVVMHCSDDFDWHGSPSGLSCCYGNPSILYGLGRRALRLQLRGKMHYDPMTSTLYIS